jgi:hypothetical protein
LKNGTDFLKWCTSWSGNLNIKNLYENGDKFKNGLSKKGVEYFSPFQ